MVDMKLNIDFDDGTFKKYEIDADLGQEILFELWDYDAGFPGSENDDYLGRCWLYIFFHFFNLFFISYFFRLIFPFVFVSISRFFALIWHIPITHRNTKMIMLNTTTFFLWLIGISVSAGQFISIAFCLSELDHPFNTNLPSVTIWQHLIFESVFIFCSSLCVNSRRNVRCCYMATLCRFELILRSSLFWKSDPFRKLTFGIKRHRNNNNKKTII